MALTQLCDVAPRRLRDIFLPQCELASAPARCRLTAPLLRRTIVLDLWPACPLPGNYSYATSSDGLGRKRRGADLPSTVLEKFEKGI
jgi:hypothetical protein